MYHTTTRCKPQIILEEIKINLENTPDLENTPV
jgi:hypothetical protein